MFVFVVETRERTRGGGSLWMRERGAVLLVITIVRVSVSSLWLGVRGKPGASNEAATSETTSDPGGRVVGRNVENVENQDENSQKPEKHKWGGGVQTRAKPEKTGFGFVLHNARASNQWSSTARRLWHSSLRDTRWYNRQAAWSDHSPQCAEKKERDDPIYRPTDPKSVSHLGVWLGLGHKEQGGKEGGGEHHHPSSLPTYY